MNIDNDSNKKLIFSQKYNLNFSDLAILYPTCHIKAYVTRIDQTIF